MDNESGKQWWHVTVTFHKENSKGEELWSVRHKDMVYSQRQDAERLALRRNKGPADQDDFKTRVHVRELRDNDSFVTLS